jgi:hypothetical protein
MSPKALPGETHVCGPAFLPTSLDVLADLCTSRPRHRHDQNVSNARSCCFQAPISARIMLCIPSRNSVILSDQNKNMAILMCLRNYKIYETCVVLSASNSALFDGYLQRRSSTATCTGRPKRKLDIFHNFAGSSALLPLSLLSLLARRLGIVDFFYRNLCTFLNDKPERVYVQKGMYGLVM